MINDKADAKTIICNKNLNLAHLTGINYQSYKHSMVDREQEGMVLDILKKSSWVMTQNGF